MSWRLKRLVGPPTSTDPGAVSRVWPEQSSNTLFPSSHSVLLPRMLSAFPVFDLKELKSVNSALALVPEWQHTIDTGRNQARC